MGMDLLFSYSHLVIHYNKIIEILVRKWSEYVKKTIFYYCLCYTDFRIFGGSSMPKMIQVIFETGFDIVYLVSVIWIGVLILNKTKGSKSKQLFGYAAILLGVGDSFHLIPRMLAHFTDNGFVVYAKALGIGQLITSITMTVFYCLLLEAITKRYRMSLPKGQMALTYILAIARVVLCLMPQNEWTNPDSPVLWGIIRNIPFLLLGIEVMILSHRWTKQARDPHFDHLALTIFLSFAFYIPVVLVAGIYPIVGILMLPKTVCYFYIVWMSYRAISE